jgi:23S rRNA (guanosine2251-2'-O)-methyltransferase
MHRTPRQQLDQLLPALRHQGAVARCHGAPRWSEADLEVLLIGLPHPPLVLVLDGIQDPHNLGACLRSADAAGVHAIVAPRDRAVGITPAVRKVASGAAETVPFVQVTNLARTLRHLQELGLWRVGAAGEAPVTLYEVDLRGPLALLLGAEGKGLRRLTREHCDTLVRIPMLGAVASLNVAVATGICLFEAQRQRTVGAAHAATAASDPTPTGR